MGTVETARGPIPISDLGRTLMHEHVFVLTPDHLANYGPGGFWVEDDRVADAVVRLSRLKDKGIDSIVDPTVVGLGRDIPRIVKVAQEVEVNIVVATGVYTYGDLPFAYVNRGPGTMLDGPEPMVDDFVRDLTVGIADTGVKAAFLKCAVEHTPMSTGVERSVRAVAQAHLATRAPITVHTSAPEQTARPVIELLRHEGVDLEKVVIGHAGDSNDLDYLMELADTGAILGMDRFGLDLMNPTAERIETIVALVQRGYGDRMVLAHDASCFIDWFGPDFEALHDLMTPNWHYEHISDDVLPALAAAGVSDEALDLMLVGTPARYFTPRP